MPDEMFTARLDEGDHGMLDFGFSAPDRETAAEGIGQWARTFSEVTGDTAPMLALGPALAWMLDEPSWLATLDGLVDEGVIGGYGLLEPHDG